MQNKIIIDVRSKSEFSGGNIPGSINIPLQVLESEIEKIKSYSKPIYLCCASGNRSGVATSLLKNYGIECTNIGSWTNYNNL